MLWLWDDFADMLDPAGVGYKLMTGRTASGAPVYPAKISGTLAPAYVLRKPRRLTLASGDEIIIAGDVYAPADPLLAPSNTLSPSDGVKGMAALLVLSDGDATIVAASVYQDINDLTGAVTFPFQVISFS